AWYELPIDAIEAPEDWSGPFDGVGGDDLGDAEEAEEETEFSDEDDLLADRED
ncbi:MAG: hypothetical protein QG599_3085, partial [Pseudomonadota bacterium]|nr:hypothetical protein [Pseudomonadota bacterium]